MIPISLIGAGQRSIPALTSLFLRWTGIPDLERVSFGYERGRKTGPCSNLRFPPGRNTPQTIMAMHDVLGSEADERVVRQNLILAYNDYRHDRWWRYLVTRELQEVQGPLEWWWWLACLRHGGLKQASISMMGFMGVDARHAKRALLSFVNPSLPATTGKLVESENTTYEPPMALRISWPEDTVTIPLSRAKESKLVTTSLLKCAMKKGGV